MILRRPSQKGFSLVELLVVIVVVSVALLGILASLAFGLNASDHAQRMTQATNLAREAITLLRDNNVAFTPALKDPITAKGKDWIDNFPSPLDSLPKDTNMKMKVDITTSLGTGYKANLARIQVTIFWTIKGHEKHIDLVAYQRKPI